MRATHIIRTAGGAAVHALLAEADHPEDGPLLVAVHGGGYTGEYFALGEHSLTRCASFAGLPVLAIDRPNYGVSEAMSLPFGEAIAHSARVVEDFVNDALKELDRPRPVMLIGHSIGAMIVLQIAATKPAWDLVGISVDGVGIDPRPGHSFPTSSLSGERVPLPTEVRRAVHYGPASTYSASVFLEAMAFEHDVPVEEVAEALQFHERVAALAPEVVVPVMYGLAEHDGLMTATEETVARFAALFTSAPRVDAQLIRGAGHNIDLHYVAKAHNLRRIAFALECSVEDRQPA